MIIRHLAAAAAVSLSFASQAAHAAPVDLSGWIAEGQGNWILQPGNDAVFQSVNGLPTVFHNDTNSQGLQLSGTIQVQTDFDDDQIGFVLGYQAGDLFNASPDFILIDWRQADQFIPQDGCTVQEGLSVMRITGDIGDFSGLACRDGSNGVTELARGATLGEVGWEDFVEYTFDLIFTQDTIQVLVDGVLEINLTGNFADGAFGFYNASQQEVLYAGIVEDDAVVIEVPAPAGLGLVLFGSAMALAARRGRIRA
ncbi:MAG: PEP-CTERM sorting domain-containing protein [Alphaproteobacteria bacterium]|nr:MAG: PEP-CTERM sorting domain-containing protein [Alphaproteobacteria bacterium]